MPSLLGIWGLALSLSPGVGDRRPAPYRPSVGPGAEQASLVGAGNEPRNVTQTVWTGGWFLYFVS